MPYRPSAECVVRVACVKTQKSVKDVNKPVKKALVGQSNLMVINIIINTIIGLIFPLMLIYNAVSNPSYAVRNCQSPPWLIA